MKYQVLLHKTGADSGHGYRISESITSDSVEFIQDLDEILKASGYYNCPFHTILYGGHAVDHLATNVEKDDRQSHHRTILVIPKDPVVKILPRAPHCDHDDDHVWTLSVGNYEGMVRDLEGIVQSQFDDRAGEIHFIDSMGKILDKNSSLLSANVFDPMNQLICRNQIEEYFSQHATNDRMTSVLCQARALQQRWCAVGDVRDEVEQVQQVLKEKLKEGESECSARFSGRENHSIESFTYDRFKQDFPPELALPLMDSALLVLGELQAKLARSIGENSACPALARIIIDTLTSKLTSPALELATRSAEMFSTLIDPIITLADKRPMKHNHDDYKQKLSTVEFSL